MVLTLTDGLAGLALFISLLSVVSAGKSASHAESSAASAILANHLAQHNERLALYKSLQKFHFELQIRAHQLPDAVLWAFSDAAKISEFYFPEDVAQRLVNISDKANKYLAMCELWRDYCAGGVSEANSARVALESAQEQGRVLRSKCEECDDAMRVHLRMVT